MIGQQQAQNLFDQRNESVQRGSGNSQFNLPQQGAQVGQTVSDSEQRDVAVVAVLGYN